MQDKPMAAAGLISYRYNGLFGWIMIGAKDDADALNEARRSTGRASDRKNLEVWDGARYVPVDDDDRLTFFAGASGL